jgi:SpoVK/Ycf46/Vps4 family AAA+-type ATPase
MRELELTASEEIELLVKARYPIIYIVSHEEKRVLVELQKIASRVSIGLFKWTQSKGIVDVQGRDVGDGTNDPDLAMDYVLKQDVSGLFVFLDFHCFISPAREMAARFIRKLRDVANTLPDSPRMKSLLLLSPVLEIPLEIEKDIAVVDFPLPGLKEFAEMLKDIEQKIRKRNELKIAFSPEGREEFLRAALGLTLAEAENAFAKALIEDSKLDDDDVVRILKEKEQLIKKSGMLEYISPDQSKKIGGLENLKEWFQERSEGFSERAREFHLPQPRGVLLIGVPGCGKSLCANVLASQWKKPLLRFDVGRAFGKYVGESETNMRRAIKTAESLAPCILWIDEIEKEFGGASGDLDSGTSARVFASFLTWMQEKKSAVFVLATANNIKRLPAEFLRKGRFDEVFFVDLPFDDERKEIFQIHILNRRRNPDGFDLDLLAKESEGYSGAEIEEAIISTLYRVFKLDREPKTEDILQVLKDTVPLSEMMKEQIQNMRSWAKQRARYASRRGRTEKGEIIDRWTTMG